MASHKACPKEKCNHRNIPILRDIHNYLHNRQGWYHDWHHHQHRMTIHMYALLAALIISGTVIFELYRISNIPVANCPGPDWEPVCALPDFGK